MEQKHKYEEFYHKYKTLIDAEFASRYEFKLQELLTSLENRVGYIKNDLLFTRTDESDFLRIKKSILEEMQEIIGHEINMPPLSDYMFLDKFDKLKNNILINIESNFIKRGEDRSCSIKMARITAMIENLIIESFNLGAIELKTHKTRS